jgi:hypothetical protein
LAQPVSAPSKAKLTGRGRIPPKGVGAKVVVWVTQSDALNALLAPMAGDDHAQHLAAIRFLGLSPSWTRKDLEDGKPVPLHRLTRLRIQFDRARGRVGLSLHKPQLFTQGAMPDVYASRRTTPDNWGRTAVLAVGDKDDLTEGLPEAVVSLDALADGGIPKAVTAVYPREIRNAGNTNPSDLSHRIAAPEALEPHICPGVAIGRATV